MNHPSRRISCAILLPFILAVLAAGSAFAGSIDLGYGGDGIYPRVGTANSERYFRVQASWNPSTENFVNLRLECSAGTYWLREANTDLGVAQFGVTSYVTTSSSTSRVAWYTIGPFAGRDIWGQPHQGTVNTDSDHPAAGPNRALSTPGPALGMSAGSGQQFRFVATFRTTGTTPTTSTEYTSYMPERVVHDNQEYLQWYSGDAAGVDPIAVEPATINPDDGTGSSRYRFRVRYARISSMDNLPPRTQTSSPPTGGPVSNFAEYNYNTGLFETRWDRNRDTWMYGAWDDWHSGDRIGFYQNLTQPEPEVILIIDGNLARPRLMQKEDPANNNYDSGVVYFYDILPTDYKRYLENVFLFPYDPAGPDQLDLHYTSMRGKSMSNNYVAMSAGGHTYEFIASSDFSPPRNRVWAQVGRPGHGLYNDYIRTLPDRAAMEFPELAGFEVNDQPATDHHHTTTPPLNTRFIDSDGAAGGTGYPYNSQDRTRYPKVDPVLTAHPYFPSGTIMSGSDFDPDPRDAGGIRVRSPFPAEIGAGPNPPLRYTNDDTILPNYVNIHPLASPTPFRGGKWTDSSLYTFRINYWQSDNIAPLYVRVHIRKVNPDPNPPGGQTHGWLPVGDWQAFTMEQMDPADRDYTDGVVFQFQATPEQLPGGGGPGDYNYYFTASDGTRTTLFPNRPGTGDQLGPGVRWDPGHGWSDQILGQYGVPTSAEGEKYYWFRVNTPPQLSNQSVAPAAGRSGDNYSFRVTYTDPDGGVLNPNSIGDRPFLARIHLDLFGDLLGQTTVAQVTGASSMTYTTASGNLYADNALADPDIPYTLTMLSGAATGMTYPIAGNAGNAINLGPGTNLSADGVASGDRFRIAQWFTGTMEPADPTDTDRTNGVVYQFNTATNVELGPGVHRYFFEFTDDWGGWLFPNDPNVKVEGQQVRHPASANTFFTGPEVRDNAPPILRDFRFTPQSAVAGEPDGTTATQFVFYVTYEDQDNDPPAFIRLGIDGTPNAPDIVLNMVPDTPAGQAPDAIFTDGAIYKSQPVRLTEGTHVFYAQTSDGKARFPFTLPGVDPYFSGPEDPDNPGAYLPSVPGPTVAANIPPTLSFPPDDDGTARVDPDDPTSPLDPPGLDPNSGRRSTAFTYRVIYTSDVRFAGVMGNPPEFVRVFIDGVGHDMTRVDPDASNYNEGVMFEHTVSNLAAGTPHTYFFLASDGLDRARLPQTGVAPDRYDGPVVLDPPRAPMNLLVQDTPNDHGGSLDVEFSASPDDGGREYDVAGYNVYRSETRGQYPDTPVLIVPATGAPAYRVQDTAPDSVEPPADDVQYFYVVKAFIDVYGEPLESDRSNEEGPVMARDNIAPNPPTGVTVTNPALGGTLDVTWSRSPDDGAGADDVVEYRIYRSRTETTFAPPHVGTAPAGATSFRDTTVTDGVPYYYVVRAFDGSHESANSNVGGPATATDEDAPVVANRQPGPGDTGVRRTATISFTVEDTGAGVNRDAIQVTVTIEGEPVQGTTDITGTPRRYNVEFTPDEPFGYQQNVRVRVDAADQAGPPANAGTVTWTFITEGEPTSVVSGQVLDTEGNPIPGDPVDIFVGPLQGIAGANGQYAIAGVADGTHTVRAVRRGWHIAPSEIAVTVPPDATDVNFVAEPGFDIVGRVLDEQGQPVGGVLITAGEKSATTRPDGWYRIQDLPAGTYDVVAVLDGYDLVGTSSTQVTLGPAAQLNFTALVQSHSLSGTVHTSAGEPMENVAVTARNVDTGQSVEVMTGPAGLYVFRRGEAAEQLRRGTYQITAVATAQTLPARTDGYEFKPPIHTVDLVSQKSDVNFTGVPLYRVSRPAQLSMVAVPVQPEDTDFRIAFGANTPVARYDATIADPDQRWITNTMVGHPSFPILDLAPGRGYWIKPAAPLTRYVPGAEIAGVGFDLELNAGWTMVGNPYQTPLPWANLAVVPGGAVADYGFIYDTAAGDYRVVADVAATGFLDTIPVGAGFWMHSTNARSVLVNPPVATASVSSPRFQLADGDFIVPLQATVAGHTDGCAGVGLVKAADSMPGGGQLANPPSVESPVDLYLIGADGARLSYDLRPATSAAQTWEFEVGTTRADVPVAITMPDLSMVPADKQVILLDTATGKRTYVRTVPQYVYQATDQPRRFQLEIGPRNVGALTISAASANAAAGAPVTVTYSLSQPASVTLSVMNISGRQVRQVVTDRAADSGINTQTWDLTGAQGAPVPSGRYLITIVAATESGQQARAVVPVHVTR